MSLIKKNATSLKGTKKGNMPFTIIAVTLLLLAGAYGIVSSNIEKNEQNAEDITTELESIGDCIDSTESFIKRGLGEIILDISSDADRGTIDERIMEFDARADSWMEMNFPLTDGVVRVVLHDYDIALDSESLGTSELIPDGYIPSFLVAIGTYSATYECDSGKADRTIEFKTDGSCALPLIAEQGSLFEYALENDGSILAQMMVYQLTALAQYRVLNGYGSLQQYGDMGTVEILTEKDVSAAYGNSLRVLEAVYFRSGDLASFDHTDLGDLIAAPDGKVTIDISAIYSQALISVMDDVVLKWFDYLYGNIILNIADAVSDTLKNAWDSLTGFFKGTNDFSAAPYIREVMKDNGYSEKQYRYLNSGMTSYFQVASDIIGASFMIDAEFPDVDLMDWGNISNFKKEYREDTNEIREWIRNIVSTAAVSIGQDKAFGSIVFNVDDTDEETFLQTISRAVSEALDKGDDEVDRIFTSAISQQKIVDPFYAAIFSVISEDAYRIYDMAGYEANIREAIDEKVTSYGKGLEWTTAEIDVAVEDMMDSHSVRNEIERYKGDIDRCVSTFDSLNHVSGGQPGIIKKLCIGIFKSGALLTDFLTDVPSRIISICDEVQNNVSVNAYEGLIQLPGTETFVFNDSNGNTLTESLDMTMDSNPDIRVRGPNDNLDGCMHYVGFNEDTAASYCTIFSLSLRDELTYTATGSNALAVATDTNDSALNGSITVELELKIAVASGWGLAGVKEYTPSNTLFGDIWNALVELLSPLLEPLREIMNMIMEVLSVFNSALIQIAKYVATMVEMLYNAIMVPLEKLKDFIEGEFEKYISSSIGTIIGTVETILNISSSKQTVGFSFMGFTLMFSTKASTWESNTKNLLTVTLSCVFDDLSLKGSIDIKQKGSDSDKEFLIVGNIEVRGDDWNIDAEIDPLMKSTNHLISMNGTVRDVAFDVVAPELIQYKQVSLCLSDVPGLGMVLSNIPVFPGVSLALDAGLELKYNAPFENGLLINEFELNPSGEDAGFEWVEIYNASSKTVDMSGYTITSESNPETKTYIIEELELRPGARETIQLPGSFLNNRGSVLSPEGERIVLSDRNGNILDKTPASSDDYNDGRTWQRASDASIDWEFKSGTPDKKNSDGFLGNSAIKTQIIEIFKDAAIDTFKEMGNINNTGDLGEYFKRTMYAAIDAGIEALAGMIVEASIFVKVEFKDVASTVGSGFRVALSVDSGIIEQGLKCLVGEIGSLLFNLENPYGLNAKDVITDNVYFGVTVYAGMTAPNFVKGLDLYPQVKLGVSVSSNLSGLISVFGEDTGTWNVKAGVCIMDCPTAVIPSALDPDMALDSDLWLVKAEFHKA